MSSYKHGGHDQDLKAGFKGNKRLNKGIPRADTIFFSNTELQIWDLERQVGENTNILGNFYIGFTWIMGYPEQCSSEETKPHK